MPRGYPGSIPGVDPGGQGGIPRRFKRKKNFVTDTGTPGHRTVELDIRHGLWKVIGNFIIIHIFLNF